MKPGEGFQLSPVIVMAVLILPLPALARAWQPVGSPGFSAGQVGFTKVCISPEGTALAFGKHYAGNNVLDLPYISPLYGELHGLPPLLIYAGGDETLLDDSTRFAQKANEAGVDITLRIGEKMFHCYPAMSPLFPEAKEAMDEICNFINKHIGN